MTRIEVEKIEEKKPVGQREKKIERKETQRKSELEVVNVTDITKNPSFI